MLSILSGSCFYAYLSQDWLNELIDRVYTVSVCNILRYRRNFKLWTPQLSVGTTHDLMIVNHDIDFICRACHRMRWLTKKRIVTPLDCKINYYTIHWRAVTGNSRKCTIRPTRNQERRQDIRFCLYDIDLRTLHHFSTESGREWEKNVARSHIYHFSKSSRFEAMRNVRKASSKADFCENVDESRGNITFLEKDIFLKWKDRSQI